MKNKSNFNGNEAEFNEFQNLLSSQTSQIDWCGASPLKADFGDMRGDTIESSVIGDSEYPEIEEDFADAEEIDLSCFDEINIEKDCNGDTFVDAVKTYLREIGSVPLLSAEEEIELAIRSADGDEEAKKKLVNSNLRLVVSVAKTYRNSSMQMLDLIQYGNLGLMKAADKFDYTKGFRFSTYATWWIRQGIRRGLNNEGRVVRIPVHMGERIARLKKARREFVETHDRNPSVEELAEILNLPKENVCEILRVESDVLSLDVPVGEEEDNCLGNFVADSESPDPGTIIELSDLSERIMAVLDMLTPREALVIKLRYGIGGNRPHTLEEVGEMLNVTRERVRQIESKALRNLRKPNCAKLLENHVS